MPAKSPASTRSAYPYTIRSTALLASSTERTLASAFVTLGVSRVFHLNVNCSNLERSLIFYRDLLGLTAGVRTAPEKPQPGGAFGLDQAQSDAWILYDQRGMDGVAIDLLEW